MILELKRRWFTAHSTIGELRVDGKFECFTLDCNYREQRDDDGQNRPKPLRLCGL